ncbi:MAG: hypothetical protein JO041_07075 [Acidobacteria bacterium]|nr:hypothetical protein [Acidobacteriota bacterium]
MIVAAFVPIVVIAVLGWLLRSQESAARMEGADVHVLEYGLKWRFVAMAVPALWTVIFVVLFVEAPPKPDDRLAMLLLIALATGTVIPYAVTVFGVSYRISPRGLEKRSPWSRNFQAPWSGVNSVSFNPVLNQFCVKTQSGTARISTCLNGLADLEQAFTERVPADAWSSVKRYFAVAAKMRGSRG